MLFDVFLEYTAVLLWVRKQLKFELFYSTNFFVAIQSILVFFS